MFNAITRLYGESTSNGRNSRLFLNPLNPAIGLSEETPPGQGCKCNSLFNDIYATTMYPKRKKGRSELQRRHDLLLHKSCHDPNAYYTRQSSNIGKRHVWPRPMQNAGKSPSWLAESGGSFSGINRLE